MIVFGLFSTTLGTLLATNFRGFRDRFVNEAQESSQWLSRVPPWRFLPKHTQEERADHGRAVSRIVGTVFAIAGPFVLVSGVVQTIKQPPHVPHLRLHPHVTIFGAVIATFMIVGMVVSLWKNRTGDGFWPRAWQQGGLSRAGLLIACLGTIPMAIGLATELQVLFMAGWAVGAVGAVIIMLTSLKQQEQKPQ